MFFARVGGEICRITRARIRFIIGWAEHFKMINSSNLIVLRLVIRFGGAAVCSKLFVCCAMDGLDCIMCLCSVF